jgi:hypothetical protein
MEPEFSRSKYVDRAARIICAFATAAFGLLAYLAYIMASPILLFWGLLGLSGAFFLLATVAPRNVRLAVVAWLPWL